MMNMAEISANGYQDIRDRIQAGWQYIELRDEAGVPIVRLPESDPRVTWTHEPGAQTLELTVVVKGDDADIAPLLPKTFGSAALYTVPTDGDPMAVESFTQFTMSTEADQLTVIFKVEVPQVV